MSERAGISCWRITALALTVALATFTSRVEAQDRTPAPAAPATPVVVRDADLRMIDDSLAAIRERAAAARAELDRAETMAREVPDDSLALSGAVLLFRRADLPEREIASLRTAFARVARQLEGQFGDEGPRLLAETRWRIQVYEQPGVMAAPSVVFVPEVRRTLTGAPVLRFPIDAAYVAELVRRELGEQLVLRHPALARWIGGGFPLDDPARTHYFAARDLAFQPNERGRRCLRGALDDCGRLLAPELYGPWRTTEGTRARNPATTTVRVSVLLYALDRARDDAGGLQTISAAPDSLAAIALLAEVAGTTPDELLTGWQGTMSAAGKARTRVAPRMLLSSTAWILLFGIVATRRRPR